jgi:hypothetical protein
MSFEDLSTLLITNYISSIGSDVWPLFRLIFSKFSKRLK